MTTTAIENKKKGISDFLQKLIDEANEAIQQSQVTIKEKLLYVYNQAIEENYTPKEARKIMEEKITVVSSRYVREVLPDEAKDTKKTKKGLISNEEQFLIPSKKEDDYEEELQSITLGSPEQEPLIGIPPEEELQPPAKEEVDKSLERLMQDKDKRIQKLVEDQIKKDETINELIQKQENYEPFKNTETLLQLQKEIDETNQLLREERAKNEEFEGRLNVRDSMIQQLDTLTDTQARQIQELSKKVTNLSTTEVIDKELNPKNKLYKKYELEAEVIHPNLPRIPLDCWVYLGKGQESMSLIIRIDEDEFKRRKSQK